MLSGCAGGGCDICRGQRCAAGRGRDDRDGDGDRAGQADVSFSGRFPERCRYGGVSAEFDAFYGDAAGGVGAALLQVGGGDWGAGEGAGAVGEGVRGLVERTHMRSTELARFATFSGV